MSIIALNHQFSILYTSLKLGKEPALLVLTSLGSRLLLTPTRGAFGLLRRVISRRRRRCELGLVSTMVYLLRQDKTLYDKLSPHAKLRLEARLENVS
jgi:hypothetical protein